MLMFDQNEQMRVRVPCPAVQLIVLGAPRSRGLMRYLTFEPFSTFRIFDRSEINPGYHSPVYISVSDPPTALRTGCKIGAAVVQAAREKDPSRQPTVIVFAVTKENRVKVRQITNSSDVLRGRAQSSLRRGETECALELMLCGIIHHAQVDSGSCKQRA